MYRITQLQQIALQITSTSPLYVRDEDIPREVLDDVMRQAAEKARRAGKNESVIEHIIVGVAEKYKNRHVLLRQAYIRDEAVTIDRLLNRLISQTGENIVIRRFIRWEIYPEKENEYENEH